MKLWVGEIGDEIVGEIVGELGSEIVDKLKVADVAADARGGPTYKKLWCFCLSFSND